MASDACDNTIIRQRGVIHGLDVSPSEMKRARTMISKSVSRLTVKGMFLMTIAVGITSSSLGVPGAGASACGAEAVSPPKTYPSWWAATSNANRSSLPDSQAIATKATKTQISTRYRWRIFLLPSEL